MADSKICVSVVFLSAQGNAKLLQQSKSGFKYTIKWNKYQSKTSAQPKPQYLDFSIVQSFQKANRKICENIDHRTSYKK